MLSGTSELIANYESNLIPFQGGFQLLVVVYDEDPLNSDDHVDNVYIESYLSPGGSIPEVSS